MLVKCKNCLPIACIFDLIHHLGMVVMFLSIKNMAKALARRSISSEPRTTFSSVGTICDADSTNSCYRKLILHYEIEILARN